MMRPLLHILGSSPGRRLFATSLRSMKRSLLCILRVQIMAAIRTGSPMCSRSLTGLSLARLQSKFRLQRRPSRPRLACCLCSTVARLSRIIGSQHARAMGWLLNEDTPPLPVLCWNLLAAFSWRLIVVNGSPAFLHPRHVPS